MINDMIQSKPPAWLLEEIRHARKGRGNDKIRQTKDIVSRFGLHTVCESAKCPNRGECFSHRTATFLILGDICTRNCAFCAVSHGKPQAPESDEPERLAKAVSELGLSHVVITSVTRDDLADGGAGHYADVVRKLRRQCPGVKTELLTPDFKGSDNALAAVLDSMPDILAHNIETVPRLYSYIRPGADYHRSLGLLSQAKKQYPNIITKSGIMLGLGETSEEVGTVIRDIAAAGCDMLTIGQYLSPSPAHAPTERYVSTDEFSFLREESLALGFGSVAAGALVRSSYKAGVFLKEMQ